MGLFSRSKNKEPDEGLKQVLEDINKMSEDIQQTEVEKAGSRLLDRCEQVLGNAREIDDAKKEYYIITSYLNDIELIENLGPDQAGEIQKAAEYVTRLNQSRDQFLNTSRKISDAQFQMMQRMEDQIPDEIHKLRENEEYQAVVRRDMQYLEGEKQEWELRKKDRRRQRRTLRKTSLLLFTAVATAAVLLLVLSFGFEYDLQPAWLATIAIAVLGAAYTILSLESGRREIQKADASINYAISLLNKVKIKYVIITNAVDYACEKYHVRDAAEFEYQWDMYQEVLHEQEKYRQTNEDLNYYYNHLVRLLKKCRLYDARVWIEQPQALVDAKEMVEIKHNLLVRRQKLRSKISYNLDIVKKERREIIELIKKEKEKDPQVLKLVLTIDKLAGLSRK